MIDPRAKAKLHELSRLTMALEDEIRRTDGIAIEDEETPLIIKIIMTQNALITDLQRKIEAQSNRAH